MLQPHFLHFFRPVLVFFHTVTKSFSADGFWAPLFLLFVCYCKTGTLRELVCEHLFFLSQQSSCFSISFIGIESFFSLTRITYPSVSDIKSIKSSADNPWTFPKRLLPLISFITEVKRQEKLKLFLFPQKSFLHEKRTVAKSFFLL